MSHLSRDSTSPDETYKLSPGKYPALEVRAGKETNTQKIWHRVPDLSNKSLGMLMSPSGQWNDEASRKIATEKQLSRRTHFVPQT